MCKATQSIKKMNYQVTEGVGVGVGDPGHLPLTGSHVRS
jgi:hypothetical protein